MWTIGIWSVQNFAHGIRWYTRILILSGIWSRSNASVWLYTKILYVLAFGIIVDNSIVLFLYISLTEARAYIVLIQIEDDTSIVNTFKCMNHQTHFCKYNNNLCLEYNVLLFDETMPIVCVCFFFLLSVNGKIYIGIMLNALDDKHMCVNHF